MLVMAWCLIMSTLMLWPFLVLFATNLTFGRFAFPLPWMLAILSPGFLVLFLLALGGGLGVLMGLFFGALENPIMSEEMTARQQIVYQAKQMGRKSMSHAKTFAVMGLIFSAAECVVEKARAKHDITNSAVAGCVTGGALAAKGGPQATCIGCVGFGAFSVAIEKFMERHT
ncbi:Mitochondrial import inner membrane translocase subunit TIM22 [Triticum urartu]|uniref:Mitochondrial import inner membrane translocase subunit TIM22 n=2 Tax=Triticum TaxID=4564 RepID=A0A9R1AXC5_TRITD|nr:Mitochondrial import inner membrane translocase subunit TIM22 [Triticum urartu]VAI43567.1 unnamed protein product [Triticum turgidum subsp. durum]